MISLFTQFIFILLPLNKSLNIIQNYLKNSARITESEAEE